MFVLCFCQLADAQVKMTLLNGKEISVNTYELGDHTLRYTFNKGEKLKKRSISRYQVFGLEDEKGAEIILYSHDSLDDYSMTVEQARSFIMGEQLAMRQYRRDMNAVAAFSVGGSSGLLSFYGLPVPVIYSLVVERFSPDVPVPAKEMPAGVQAEPFEAGYQQKVRGMKLKQNLISGSIGFAVGITVFTLWLGDVNF